MAKYEVITVHRIFVNMKFKSARNLSTECVPINLSSYS